jgi:hypothetical protein
MNEVLQFLRTQKNGDSFLDSLTEYEKIYKRKGHRYRVNCAEQIYSHALKYRHFIFFEYFMQYFTIGWRKGLECLCSSSIKHRDFLYLFEKFKFLYFSSNKRRDPFINICQMHSALVLKRNSWNWFEKYMSLWQSSIYFSESVLHLLCSCITFKISFNKYIQLLEKCSTAVYDEKQNFKNQVSCVFYEKVLKYYDPKNTRMPYGELLLMYGAELSHYLRMCHWLLDSCEEYFYQMHHKVFTIIFLYCFQLKNVQILF